MAIAAAVIEKKEKPRKDSSAKPQHRRLLLFVLKLGHQPQWHSGLPLGLTVSMMLVCLSHLVLRWQCNGSPIYTFYADKPCDACMNESLKWTFL